MNTITLDDDELRLVRQALEAYLEEFGHEEPDIVRRTKALIARIGQAQRS